MPFQKNNKLGALPFNDEPFDASPVCFKVKKGVKDKLKAVPNWQERLREFVDNLIEGVDE
ncbi:hypothetical protein NIES4075_61350 [Tolypothrix sp. NIES-4075]|uniref:hypothetical protein n=1 Tax=Tolypothrix sp. NIES-4075 TaxID=2005459 RepID=UPI000B5C32FC|nr:hypothetical protein [Tolypothrix sp. NIES-4075]GAX45114.1 hypothetical protein NIES4075_61350 [Tolypothrix sp. NIES-4075]